jgi:hypothetical protein
MRRVAAALPLLVAIGLIPGTASAGGWARHAGGVYARAGAAYFDGRAAFLLPDAPGAPSGTFHSIAAELYGEVGLGRGFELDLSARWVDNAHELSDGVTRRSRGPEDAELLLKWSPVHAHNALAFLIGTRVAMYERLDVGDTLDGTPQRGSGGVDLLTGVSFGHSFHPTRAWVVVDVLHRLRFGGPSSGVLTRAEAGWMFAPPLGGALLFEIQPAFGRDLDQRADAPAPVPKILSFGAKLFLELPEGFGLAADAFWLPDVLNDGPGFRVAAGVTYQR